MNKYQHLTADERHQITAMRRLHYTQAKIAKVMSRSPSTISRELRRNVTRHDGWYRAEKAQSYATAPTSLLDLEGVWDPSRGRAALASTPSPAPERRAAAAGRCTPRRSRGTLKDGPRRPERVDNQARSTGLTVVMAKAPWTGCQKLV